MKVIQALLISFVLTAFCQAGAPIKDLRVSGTSSVESGTFTFANGVTITAASGSTVDLSAATITFATNQIGWVKVSKTGSSLADLATRSAGDLSSGTLPNAVFPATLPAVGGANITNLNGSNIASGTVAIARGGTGTGTAPTAGQVLIGQTAGTYVPATLTAGANVTITSASGAITIASTAGGSTTLAGLTDINISSPANGQGLVYDSTSGKWKNSSSSGGGLSDPTTTKGDIMVNNGSTITRQAVGGTNGFVLTVDSSQSTGIKWAAQTGGSVGTWITNSQDAPPASPSGFNDEFASSATLPGGGSAIWSWANQNSATAVITNDKAVVTVPSGSPKEVCLVQSVATAPYTITCRVSVFQPLMASGCGAGIVLRTSSSGAMKQFTYKNNSGTPTFLYSKWSNATTFASATSYDTTQTGVAWVYLQLQDDNTNIYFRYSFDGVVWKQLTSEARNTTYTQDQFGVVVCGESASASTPATFEFFRVTQP